MSSGRSTLTNDDTSQSSAGLSELKTTISAGAVVAHERGQVIDVETSESTHVQRPVRKRFQLPRPPVFWLSFALLVIAPSIASQVYLMFVASDQYLATTRFAVRSAQEASSDNTASLSAVGQSGGLSQVSIAGQDAHIVAAYIRSRAIIDDLSKNIDVRAIFRRPEADFWAKLKNKASAEEVTDYWREMVTTNIDGPSGIVTVYARSFRRQDSLDLANGIVQVCETLINNVSQRARLDALSRAEAEMRRSDGMVQQALADMRDFRDKVGIIDPVATATMTSKLITEAMAEKIKIENELFVGQKVMSASAPSLLSLQTRLSAVNNQIDKLKATLTGNQNSDLPLSKSLVRFEELELKRVFAEKLYTISQDALEQARVRSEKQNVYIDVFVPPSLPEEARYPERISLSIIIPLSLMVVWGIFALLLSTIEDHRT